MLRYRPIFEFQHEIVSQLEEEQHYEHLLEKISDTGFDSKSNNNYKF